MRVALVTGPDPGHLIPVAGTAAQLRDAGHEPVVVTSERWAAALGRDGLPFLPLPLIGPTPRDADIAHRLYVRPVEMAGPLAAGLRSLRLDLIVADTLTRVGGVTAGLLDLPWVELIPHPLPDPSVALPPFGTGWTPRPRRDRRYAARTAASLALGEQQKRTALAAAGLVDVPPVHRMVATLPALEPARPDWPAGTTVVVPPTWEPADVDLAPPPGDGPLVLVVGSTASSRSPASPTAAPTDLLSSVVAALGPSRPGGWRVVSPRFGPDTRDLPGWVAAGPGRLAPLLNAAAATVSSGGHGMVVASLRAGVPLVLVPGPGDQKEVAARVARIRAGMRVRHSRRRPLGWPLHHPSRPALPQALRTVIDSPVARAAAFRAGDVTGVPSVVSVLEAAGR
ncbi:MAG TPA: glycosyl transferase [Mycobacteriales bacterium]